MTPATSPSKKKFPQKTIIKPSLRNLLAFVLAALTVVAGPGCSKSSWRARFYLIKAEDAAARAYTLRTRKDISYRERLGYYRQACVYFLRAYQTDPGTFSLNRIESAAESCLRIEDFDGVETFREFEERYIREHPTEAEYGDAVPIMSVEG